MNEILELSPELVWRYFMEICEIPRLSKSEGPMRDYLKDFGQRNKLEVKEDKAGNIVIRKNAHQEKQNSPVVILQTHMDMVGEKNAEITHDFSKDPVKPYIDKGWVKARGTTLGADNGIGIAMQLAILASDDIKHGPLEMLFTVDEETGLTGAFNLDSNLISGKLLINLDSEDEGEIFIGSAGGIDTIANFKIERQKMPYDYIGYKMSVKGLRGGHSGDDIHKGYGNANSILARFLWNAEKEFGIKLSSIEGGNLRNAIPRESQAVIGIPVSYEFSILGFFRELKTLINTELHQTEPGLKMTLEKNPLPQYAYEADLQHRILTALYTCPNGVVAWSQDMPGLVETSTNLASVKEKEDLLCVTTSQRSALDSAKINIAGRIEALFTLSGANVEHSDGYPGWSPNPESALLKKAVESYQDLFGIEPKVKAVHAGLECGLFLDKYPDLDIISVGPTIKNAHSPDEQLNIESTEKFWVFLLDILKRI